VLPTTWASRTWPPIAGFAGGAATGAALYAAVGIDSLALPTALALMALGFPGTPADIPCWRPRRRCLGVRPECATRYPTPQPHVAEVQIAGETARVLVERIGAVDSGRLGQLVGPLAAEVWGIDDYLTTPESHQKGRWSWPRQGLCLRQALGSWSEFGKIAPHSLVGCAYASPLSWTMYSHSVLGAFTKSLSEKFTGPNSPLAL